MPENEWEARYLGNDMPWEKGEASPGLVDFLKQNPNLERGRVAVPGCGTGHDVRAWAGARFEARGFDLAPSAIRLAREKTLPNLPAKFAVGNFLADRPPVPFDWLFEHTLFCAIDPAQRDEYVQAALRWIAPAGQFLAVFYMIPDIEGPPFGTTRDEIMKRFSPHFDLLKDWVPRSYENRTGLEWMTHWRKKA